MDTNQPICYDHTREIPCPLYDEPFFGQDAHHKGRSPSYVDNGDGTITDVHAGLMWQKTPGEKVSYSTAISHAKSLNLARYDDWWLPNAKELHSIVDYTRSPAPSNSAAIDPIFNTTAIRDEEGEKNYPNYWTSTIHASAQGSGSCAVYIAFGEALGYMRTPGGAYEFMDVHGVGAQRSDPKTGDPDE